LNFLFSWISCFLVMESEKSRHLLGFKRFLDDIMGLWTGSKEEFISWAHSVNCKFGTWVYLSRTMRMIVGSFHRHQNIVFLDIRSRYDQMDGSLTDVNIKSTNARVYSHFSSFHPRSTFKSINYSMCLRYRRIINDNKYSTVKPWFNTLFGGKENSTLNRGRVKSGFPIFGSIIWPK
jgi:hypothetical protein